MYRCYPRSRPRYRGGTGENRVGIERVMKDLLAGGEISFLG